MRAKKIVIPLAGILACAAGFLALAAFAPPVQTWLVRKALARVAPPGTTVEAASFGLDQVWLFGLRLDGPDGALSVPTVHARLELIPAILGRGLRIRSLAAKDWTLDLSRPPARGAETPAAPRSLAALVGGMVSAFNVPARVSLDGVDLSGTLVLADASGRRVGSAGVTLAGGGLAAGQAGTFRCTSDASIDDAEAPVQSVEIHAELSAAMDASATFTRIAVTMATKASGRQFPRGISLSGSATAVREAGAVSYALTLTRGSETVAEVDAVSREGSPRLDGAWRFDLRDSDLQPFALGRRLPAFSAVGTGRYRVDASTGNLHTEGALHAAAGRLEAISPALGSVGNVVVESVFDLTRTGRSLRVDKLECSVSGAQPVASVRALQSFEFDMDTGELKVGQPAGDLVGISLTGLPLPWLRGPLPWLDAEGTNARGEFVMRSEGGLVALRTQAPLTASDVSLWERGRLVGTGLDLSAFVLADYAPLGWQVQISPLAFKSGGVRILSLEARFGRLSGADADLKAAGSWSASLPPVLRQPLAAGLPALASGDASGSFEASLGVKSEVRVKIAVQNLEAGPAFPARLPASLTSEVRADFSAAGGVAFYLPLRLDYGSRAADMVLSGTYDPESADRVADVTLSGSGLDENDLGVLLALSRGRPQQPLGPVTEPAQASALWPSVRGKVAVKLRSLALWGQDLRDLAATVTFDPATLRVENASATLGASSPAHLDGLIDFSPAEAEPFQLHATLDVGNVDSAPFFRAAKPGKEPAVEGRFDVSAKVDGQGGSLAAICERLRGELKLSSSDGRFRGLRSGTIDSVRQTPSRIVEAVDSVASLFSKKTEKIGEALVDSANELSDVHYDQMSITAERGSDLDIHLTDITLIAPEERLTGQGTVTHVDGVPIASQPFSADLNLSVRGHLHTVLDIVGMLKEGQDALGYTELYQPIHLGGTLDAIDESQWRSMLLQAPLRKGGGLIDKLLGR